MRFWFLSDPDYSNDYKSIFVNGVVEYPFQLPLYTCPECGDCPMGGVLPLECPENLSESFRFQPGERVSFQEYLDLCTLLGTDTRPWPGALRPGVFHVPSRPEHSFLWPGGTVIVSQETLGIIRRLGSCRVFQLLPGYIGSADSGLEPLPPPSGEPSDLLPHGLLPQTPNRLSAGTLPFYELVPPPVEQKDVTGRDADRCTVCGCRQGGLSDFTLETEFRLSTGWSGYFDAAQWNGESIFKPASATKPVITDVLKDALEAADCSNYDTRPCPSKDEYDQGFAEFKAKRSRPWWRFW